MSSSLNALKLPNTLSFRLTLWYAVAFIFFLALAFGALYLSIDSILDGRMEDDLTEDIAELRLLHQMEGFARVEEEINREVNPGNAGDVFFRLFDTGGRLLYETDLSEWQGLNSNTTYLQRVAQNSDEAQFETLLLPERDSVTKVIYGSIGGGIIMQIGESMEETEEILSVLINTFTLMFAVFIPLSCAMGWFIARKAASGIEEVSRAALDIEHGNLNRRVNIKNQHDEVQNLASTFNAMAKRIRKLIAEMREMTDNIAHDLRSPLARIRALSEGVLSGNGDSETYQAAAGRSLEECDRLIRLINATLDVAEAEAGVGNHKLEAVDMSKLVHDACELFQPVAEQKHIELHLNIATDCFIHGNKHNLQRMLANIVDNALKYTPANGEVSVSLSKQAENIEISVADTGIGIPLEEQQRVFERFYRCDQSRSNEGCGLGLSFSRAVARSHGGDITLHSQPAQSSLFTVILPLPVH